MTKINELFLVIGIVGTLLLGISVHAATDTCAKDPLTAASKPCKEAAVKRQFQDVEKLRIDLYESSMHLAEENLPYFTPNDHKLLRNALAKAEDAWIKNRDAHCGLYALVGNSGLSNNTFDTYETECELEITKQHNNELMQYKK